MPTMDQEPTRPVEILLVEDSPADTRLTIEGLKDSKLVNNLHTVVDGEQALDFLYRRGVYKGAPKPDMILLDLNLPGVDGREVLNQIKTDSELALIPVVIMTSSSADADVLHAYRMHANCYIQKPLDFAGFQEIVRSIKHFWFQVVKLPTVD